ncbi:hypothetical protein LSTR_LSTR007240 [Laodelphax striatellus]|uniref:Protein broad-minded n=1 Tax=Laodelphax striatellus TaxID=195883 RepID=A0A482XDF1_LAOST|nr:hypothetical protein LSTR_LSTR007240 [Laodelphax striatellus]
MDNQVDIDNLCEGMKEMFINHALGRQISNGLDVEEVSNNSNLAMKVRSFIDTALTNNMNNELQSLNEVNPHNWQMYASRIARTILESSQMSCTQENLNNMLETCTQELITRFSHHFENYDFSSGSHQRNLLPIDAGNDAAVSVSDQPIGGDLSSLLRPHNFAELAQSISLKTPLYVRVQSLNILLSSQISDAISSNHWESIQKCLQVALCDESFEVFQLGLQMHAKLVQSSIPEATKESFLNTLESLCQHYHLRKSDFQEILFQVPSHFRMIRMCSLLLIIIKDLTLNLPRFGEKRLIDMIENFVHLLTIQGNKNTTNVSPYNFLACLDPDANWIDSFIQSASSRRLLLGKLSENNTFISIAVQDTMDWLKNPSLPTDESGLLNDYLQGKITKNVVRFSNFLHGLSLISKICSFESGLTMFPVMLNKTETVRLQDITEMVLRFLNEQQLIEERMEVVFSDSLTKLLVSAAVSLMKIKENQNSQLLQIVFEPLARNPITPLYHTVLLLDMLAKLPEGPQNCFFRYGAHNRKKILVVSPSSADVSQRRSVGKDVKSVHERQNSLNASFCPMKIFINCIIKLLNNRELRNMALTAKLLDIGANILRLHEGIAILELNKCQLLNVALSVYEELTALSRSQGGDNILVERNCYLLYSSLQNFIIKVGTTPLGFSMLVTECPSAVTNCLLNKLEQLDTPWECPDWRIFVTYCVASQNDDKVIGEQALAKSQLLDLWAALEVETDSTIDIDERKQQLFTVMATCASCLQGVMAIVNHANDADNTDDYNGSDDTITEQLFEYRPTTANEILSKKSLLEIISCDYRVQETVLTVLNIFTAQLNCALYLQAKLQIQELLLAQQKSSRIDESSDTVIIDECSLLRHEILERSHHVSAAAAAPPKLYFALPCGPVERRQRPRTGKHGGCGELARFVQETRSGLHDATWLKQARKAYRAGCVAGDEIKCGLFVDLVSLVQKTTTVGDTGNCLKWPTVEQVERVVLLSEEEIGVQLVIRYGLNHRLLQSSQHNSENLSLLLRMTKLLFGKVEQETFTGFDWFLSTIFLISSGNVERCQNILSVLVTMPCIMIIWPRYAEFQSHKTDAFGHLLESLISYEAPLAFNALRMGGVSWWQVCRAWLTECCWRLMSCRDVCGWLTFLVLHSSAEYSLYALAAILLHSHKTLLQRANQLTLWTMITNPPDRLSMNDLLPHIDKLWKRYHSGLLPLLISSTVGSAH